MKDNEFFHATDDLDKQKIPEKATGDEFKNEYTRKRDETLVREETSRRRNLQRRLLQMLCSVSVVVILAEAAVLVIGGKLVKGFVLNALTGEGITSVSIAFHQGDANGTVVATTTTGEDGSYEVKLPTGYHYTATISCSGFANDNFQFDFEEEDEEGEEKLRNGTMMPVNGDGYTVVLTWGENPSDLDSHMCGLDKKGYAFHIYYSDRSYSGSDGLPICYLDVDDTDSYGPETVTLLPESDKPYYYYVYNYSGNGSIYESGAQVKVYYKSILLKTFNAPASLGESRYWNVFALKNGRIILAPSSSVDLDMTYAGSLDSGN